MRATATSTFRRFAAVEEQMIRAAMPRTSAADPEPLTGRRVVMTVVNRGTSRLVRFVPMLTATMMEMANA